MKGFFKTFLAVLLALVVVSLLPFFIIIGMVGSLESEAPVVGSDSVLVINLDENITDSPRMPTFSMSGSSFELAKSLTMLEVATALEKAATDPNIEALYINLTGLGTIATTAHIEEIRGLLTKFKEASGKPIYAYNETYSQGAYWLATVADKLYMNPQGGLDWRGLASQSLFFKKAIDKLGVDVQIVRHGTYKSAVEPYMLTEMSPANRRQTEAMVNTLWGVLVEDISSARKISTRTLNEWAGSLAIDSPRKAAELGMVDGLRYEDEVLAELADVVGADEANLVTLGEYCLSATIPTKVTPNKVAIVYADGEIVDGKGSEGIVGGATTAEQIRRAREDKGVKAVVLRVNSPGGSALASEVMWRELKLLQQEKPLVVSMSGYAASGGYYISSAADQIISGRTTLTGSIGVFGVIVSGKDVLEDRVGVTVDVAKTSPHADMGTLFRPLSGVEMEYMQRSVEDVYSVFLGHVADGRNMAIEAVDAIGEGRVWCGSDAMRIGLVDGFGGLQEALAEAAKRAELGDNWRAVEILEEEDELMAAFGSFLSTKVATWGGKDNAVSAALNSIVRMLDGGSSVQARMPYDITIY